MREVPPEIIEARKYRVVCKCGVKKKSYPLLGRGSNVMMCPVCDDEEHLLSIVKECGFE